jgi:protein SCO1/2
MSDAFSTAQKELLKRTSGPTNWQLLSISFDPEFDTPGIMKSYGQRWNADPKHWTLATGAFDQIEPFAVSVGLYFGRGVSIADQNHNLRTLIIGPTGRLAKLFPGNEWTGAELAEALLEAAQTK